MKTEAFRMADQAGDYRQLGIARGDIAPWEDGFRTSPGGPGTFEWWYFDAVLDDGATLVINFLVKDIRGGKGLDQPPAPVITFELDRADGTHVERTAQVAGEDAFFSSTGHCDVHMGDNSISGDLHTYNIRVEMDGVSADVRLTGQVPSWRPETGHMYFGDGDKRHTFAWLPSVPQGEVDAILTIDGKTEHLRGIGYHDHNWGDEPMRNLMHHWYWARARVDDYTVIASYITAEKKYGYTEIPIFLLAKEGKIIADNSSLVRFSKSEEHLDPVTGKPVADLVVYEYDAGSEGGERYRVTFRREKTIVQNQMIDSVKGLKRLLAKMVGFDGAYLRFTGQVTVERLSGEASTITAPGLWELMYFGKNLEA